MFPRDDSVVIIVVCTQAIVPRSSKRERIAANRVLDFVLSADQMQRIDSLDGSLQQTQ